MTPGAQWMAMINPVIMLLNIVLRKKTTRALSGWENCGRPIQTRTSSDGPERTCWPWIEKPPHCRKSPKLRQSQRRQRKCIILILCQNPGPVAVTLAPADHTGQSSTIHTPIGWWRRRRDGGRPTINVILSMEDQSNRCIQRDWPIAGEMTRPSRNSKLILRTVWYLLDLWIPNNSVLNQIDCLRLCQRITATVMLQSQKAVCDPRGDPPTPNPRPHPPAMLNKSWQSVGNSSAHTVHKNWVRCKNCYRTFFWPLLILP